MRLIDADSLKEELKERYSSDDKYAEFFGVVDNQPTAYDMEKVVEQLEEKLKLYRREEEIMQSNPCYQRGVYGFKALGYEDAIKIVNQVENVGKGVLCSKGQEMQ